MAFTGCASKSIDASCLMANVPEESLDFIANRAGEGGIAFDSGKWISELGIMSPEHPVRDFPKVGGIDRCLVQLGQRLDLGITLFRIPVHTDLTRAHRELPIVTADIDR
jgi:hypothetical protein